MSDSEWLLCHGCNAVVNANDAVCSGCGRCLNCGTLRANPVRNCPDCDVAYCECCGRCPACGAKRYAARNTCSCGHPDDPELRERLIQNSTSAVGRQGREQRRDIILAVLLFAAAVIVAAAMIWGQ